MLLRDQSVGTGLHPLIVFICRHGVPNSGRLLSTSDADGDKAAALLIGAVALFASGDGMADPGTETPPNFGGVFPGPKLGGIGGPTDNQSRSPGSEQSLTRVDQFHSAAWLTGCSIYQ